MSLTACVLVSAWACMQARSICHAQESFAAMQRTPVHVRNPDLTPVAILPGKVAHGAHL